jgi:hypothetical protein
MDAIPYGYSLLLSAKACSRVAWRGWLSLAPKKATNYSRPDASFVVNVRASITYRRDRGLGLRLRRRGGVDVNCHIASRTRSQSALKEK